METQVFQIAPSAAKTWWVYLLMGGTVALTIAAFFFVHYMVKSSLESTFEVAGGGLVIHGGFYGRTVPIHEMRLGEARRLALGKSAGVSVGFKRNGTNMPGLKSGWFTLKTPQGKEKALLFLTDESKAVYIPTRQGYSMVLSPDDPEAFLEALKRGG